MKKAFKRILAGLITLILLIIIISTIAYNKYWAKDQNSTVTEENLEFYFESYEECRSEFISVANRASEKFSGTTGRFSVPSAVDNDLTVDYIYIPAQLNLTKLLILNSGIHGIEGYTGSAVQLMFMQEFLPEMDLSEMGVLLIHGMNPYGFKYNRKVTENNVDLNRNCVVEESSFNTKNDGYGTLTDLLMPEDKVGYNSLRNKFFHLVAINKIIKESMPVLRQAALQGQYDFNKGIYYGGKSYEPQIDSVKQLFKSIIPEYNKVLNIDLHTAYGERGKLHLFMNPINDPEIKNGVESVFRGAEIDWGSGDDFYTIHGEYVGWVESISDSVLYLPGMFEFGTLDSQKTFGSLKSIQVMINENQGIHYGYKNDKQEKKVKDHFREMYFPSAPEWRSKVIDDSREMLSLTLNNFNQLDIPVE